MLGVSLPRIRTLISSVQVVFNNFLFIQKQQIEVRLEVIKSDIFRRKPLYPFHFTRTLTLNCKHLSLSSKYSVLVCVISSTGNVQFIFLPNCKHFALKYKGGGRAGGGTPKWGLIVVTLITSVLQLKAQDQLVLDTTGGKQSVKIKVL